MAQNYLRIILIGAATAFVAPVLQAQDSALVVRRLATTARLAAEEYRLGINHGQVVLPAEVDEAKLFLAEARKAAATLPASVAGRVVGDLDRLLDLVGQAAPPDSVAAGVERMVHFLGDRLAVSLEEVPAATPSFARGEEVYRTTCQSCHGTTGGGDGPGAAGLKPPPAKLDDRARLAQSTPLDFYRRVTIGVAGTSMPAFEASLSADDRWAVALYASTLRLPEAKGAVAARWADFSVTARLSDSVLRDSLGGDLARVAAARRPTRARDYRPVFAVVRRRLDSAFRLADQGKVDLAKSAALDAYMAFEGVERDLRIKDGPLVQRLETAFARAREQADRPEDLKAIESELTLALERAERAVGTSLSPVSLFVQSFVLLVREGLEAILVVGALLTFLAKVGANGRRREIHLGVAAAVALSLVTAVAIETVFRLTPAHQEVLEAGTMVLATVMLFFVSYWLLSKMEVARWNQFVKSRMADALSDRSTLALASVAFLAVYREGFETVLFYKALALSGGEHVALPIGAGVALGAVVLGGIYVALNRFGIRLPLKPFFAVTSLFLYVMAFIFAGTAIAELQEGGFAPMTPLHWLPRIPVLGIYPTLEGALLQSLLVTLAVLALVWTFGRRDQALA